MELRRARHTLLATSSSGSTARGRTQSNSYASTRCALPARPHCSREDALRRGPLLQMTTPLSEAHDGQTHHMFVLLLLPQLFVMEGSIKAPLVSLEPPAAESSAAEVKSTAGQKKRQCVDATRSQNSTTTLDHACPCPVTRLAHKTRPQPSITHAHAQRHRSHTRPDPHTALAPPRGCPAAASARAPIPPG